MDLVRLTRRCRDRVAELSFSAPVAHVYNPLAHAWRSHRSYLQRYGSAPKEVLMIGMNPGPFGMVQTGIPFGEVAVVREWLDLEERVDPVPDAHPKRPVLGFECTRSEVSGRRLWGWARDRFGTPERFFGRFFVHNYCPLAFVADSGRNVTPDKLTAADREPLFAICDAFLTDIVEALQPTWVIGVGAFAEQRATRVLADVADVRIGRIPHPSPASPAANRGWEPLADGAFADLGIPIP